MWFVTICVCICAMLVLLISCVVVPGSVSMLVIVVEDCLLFLVLQVVLA